MEVCASGGVEAVDPSLVVLVVVSREALVNLVAERDGYELLERSLVALEVSFSELLASLLQRRNAATHRAGDVEALDEELVLAGLNVRVALPLRYLLIVALTHLGGELDV